MATSSEDSEDSDGGFILPGVKETLRSILAQYPNNGQILKEIIQNAEDAGATEIKFFLDTKPCDTSEKLLKKGLVQFQGPALYAFNNAVFAKKDWEGIRSLCTSIKKDDPIKVGRFGLGFKSVFHITDLPSVLSKNQLMIIDPHQRFLKQGTHSLYLGDEDRGERKRSDKYPGHVKAFMRVLGHPELNGAFDGASLKGTLFRFPIRLPPKPHEMVSELTKQCYKMEDIIYLLESLKQDADLILLFMKTLSIINVTILRGTNVDDEPFLNVSLSTAGDSPVNDLAKDRADFLESIKSQQLLLDNDDANEYAPIAMSALVNIKMEAPGKPVRDKKWIVSHLYAGSDVSDELKDLIQEGSVGLIPLVGCAMEINQNDVGRGDPPDGHIFCVLPLPVTGTSPSGLPVHVNGYFALDQNRAHLKWPTKDQKEGNDPQLKWNKCLISELLPKCYLQLIMKARSLNVSPTLIYQMIPDCDKVDNKWKIVLGELFKQLVEKKIIYSEIQKEWVKMSEFVGDSLQNQSKKTRNVVCDLLKRHGCYIAQVPPHVQNSITAYSSISPHQVSPKYVREQMHDQPDIYKRLNKEAKHSLLSYLLQDGDFANLDGLQLIIGCDDSESAFMVSHWYQQTENIYLPSIDKYPMALFPKHMGCFINTNDMETELVQKLRSVARSCMTQVREITDSDVLRMIKESEPAEWINKRTIRLAIEQNDEANRWMPWLDAVSNYIVKHRVELAQFESLHLLKEITRKNVNVMQLKKHSGILLEGKPEINTHLKGLLIAIGVLVIKSLPKPWDSQQQILFAQSYIHQATPNGTLQAIADIVPNQFGQYQIPEYIYRAPRKEIEALQNELSKISKYSSFNNQLIKALPIFETTDGQKVSLDSGDPISCDEAIPIDVKVRIIKSNDSVKKVASLVGLIPLHEVDLIVNYIVPYLSWYTATQTHELMLHILKNKQRMKYVNQQWEKLKYCLMNEKCLGDKNDSLCCIGELYHPSLSRLVEHKVPHKRYHNYLTTLQDFGLRTTLSNNDILQIAKGIEDNCDTSKSKELLTYIEQHDALSDCQWLVEGLSEIAWIVRDRSLGNEIPQSVQLSYPNRTLWMPSEVCDKKYVRIVGSSQPLIETTNIRRVSKAFGWCNKPPDNNIHQHMKNVSSSYTQSDKGMYFTLAKEVYQEMKGSLALQTLLINDTGSKWIWHGNGFGDSSSIAATKTRFSLEPYVYYLPSEMNAFKNVVERAPVKKGPVEEVLISTLEKMNESPDRDRNYDRDLVIAVASVNLIASKVRDNVIKLDQVKGKLLLPVQDRNCQILKLKRIDDCAYMYSAQAWLSDKCTESVLSQSYVHGQVSEDVCSTLGVPSIMNRILGNDSGFGDYGQSEDLTTRLRNILKDYKDGFAVPKELIQNADDAGATKVSFIYDERENQDAKQFLLDPEMRDLQGPALWVYNNAIFTNDDFQNIEKLGGATKAEKGNKVGKFGLGFNAVYNLTDVPSFVSGESIAIFDPHRTFLGRAVSGKPGIKLPLKLVKQLPQLADQFKPYNGVCECNLSCNDGGTSYNGTLFRFPLRRKPSKISKICYNEEEVKKLLETLEDGAHEILLFTQNVREISILKIPRESPSKDDASSLSSDVLLTIERNTLQCFRDTNPQMSILDLAYMHLQQDSSLTSKPEFSDIIKTTVTIPSICEVFLDVMPGVTDKYWLVTWSMGSRNAFTTAQSNPKLHNSLAAIAMSIEPTDIAGCYRPIHTDSASIFCFMPLPVPPIKALPVYINGFFAVTQSRRELCERKPGDKATEEAKWNETLMMDSVVCAYLASLVDLKAIIHPDERTSHYDMWPQIQHSSRLYSKFQESFYENLLGLDDGPEIFTDGISWGNAQYTVLIGNDWKVDKKDQKHMIPTAEVKHILEIHHAKSIVVTDIPDGVLTTLKSMSCFQMTVYTIDRFFKEVFFKQIDTLSEDHRNPLMLYALENKESLSHDVIQLLKTVPCIPVQPNYKLRAILDLIDPSSELRDLYSDADEVFPVGLYKCARILDILRKLGMRHRYTELTWDQILERAKSVEYINKEDRSKAKERSKQCIIAIDRNLEHQRYTKMDIPESIKQQLQMTNFLPIKQRPSNYPTELWKKCDAQYGAAANLYLEKNMHQISKFAIILDDTELIPYSVKQALGLDKKVIQLEWVIGQMTDIITFRCDDENLLEKLCSSVYAFLEEKLKEERKEEQHQKLKLTIHDALSSLECLLIDQILICPQFVAETLNPACPPYLYGLNRSSMYRKYPKLVKALKVKSKFNSDDFKKSLYKMHGDVIDTMMTQRQLEVSLCLVNHFYNAKQQEKALIDDLSEIYAPSRDGKLVLASDLCFDDLPSQWVKTTATMNFAHESLPRGLGIKTKQEKHFSLISEAIPFGQKEKLTQRLKSIIKSYPCDQSIMKELLQNADDANATELHFVLDKRQHSREKVFIDRESWGHLQGPALLVYNNRPFTEKDLEGIKNLGEGSKGNDPNKTGQYGIGFNAVYHLTDTPTFLTNGSEVGARLCAFDPNLRYVCDKNSPDAGIQIRVEDDVQTTYPDVFSCYRHESFSEKESTLFRLPLRTKEIAKHSAISNKIINPEEVQDLLKDFKSEIFDALLFVNCVEKIVIGSIEQDATGQIQGRYEVTSKVSKQDKAKLDAFNKEVRNYTRAFKEGTLVIDKIPLVAVAYEKLVTDNSGKEEKWHISRRFGFKQETEISASIKEAYEKGDLLLLPHGAVAGKCRPSDHHFSKAFCFLPLPDEIKVPVHVNGHFALDDARRSLFNDQRYRYAWNQLVLKDIVVPAYITHIEQMKAFLRLDKAGPYDTTKQSLDEYYRIFPAVLPNQNTTHNYWEFMCIELYKTIASDKVTLLPVLTTTDVCSIMWCSPGDDVYFDNLPTLPNSTAAQVTPRTYNPYPTQTGNMKVKKKCLSSVLKTLGMKLLDMPKSVCEYFNHSDVTLRTVSPASVSTFLKTWNSTEPACNLKLLVPVDLSPFDDLKCVADLLHYCLDSKSRMATLENLPLCVRQDNVLTEFSSSDPTFLSEFVDLFPEASHRFVHKELIQVLDEQSGQPVFFELTIQSIAELLMQSELVSMLYDTTTDVEIPEDSQIFRWIGRLWTCIYCTEQIKVILKEENVSAKIHNIEECLQPLTKWAIIPCTQSRTETTNFTDTWHYRKLIRRTSILVPICRSYTILDVACTRPGSRTKDSSLLDVFSNVPIPKYNSRLLPTFVQLLVTTICNPVKMLHMMLYIMRQTCKKDFFTPSEAETVLEYFTENLQHIKSVPNTIIMLRQLPLFVTMKYRCISVTDMDESGNLQDVDVYVIPRDIPTAGMDCWLQGKMQRRCFLRKENRFRELYNWLGFTSQTITELYCGFMFNHFNMLSIEDRMIHMRYLKNNVIPDLDTIIKAKDIKTYPHAKKEEANQERTVLFDGLRTLEFIEDKADTDILHPVSDFVDPLNPVWKEMRPCQCLTNPWYPSFVKTSYGNVEEGWVSFFRRFGLRSYISPEDFEKFAKEVENEARLMNMDETLHTDITDTAKWDCIDRKSRVLVKHLFQREGILYEGILSKVKSIKFIIPHLVNDVLTGIFPQDGIVKKDGRLVSREFICFEDSFSSNYANLTWTVACLLPKYADVTAISSTELHTSLTKDVEYRNKVKRMNSIKEQLHSLLSLPMEPTASLVAQNWVKICETIRLSKLNASQISHLLGICTETFCYLQKRGLCHIESEIRHQLQISNVVLVEDGHRLVMPNQLLTNPFKGEEIPGYIYKLPSNMESCENILHELGSRENITLFQLANVLKNIYDASRRSDIALPCDPNAMSAFENAVVQFFTIVDQTAEPDFLGIDNLYLQSKDDKLENATHLICNDRPDYKLRVEGKVIDSLCFMRDLKTFGLSVDNEVDLIKRLPKSFQPQMLSSVVAEVPIENSLQPSFDNNLLVEKLKLRLKDDRFINGILRLVHDGFSKSHKKNVDHVVIENLECVKIIAVKDIRTVLKHRENDEMIPDTEIAKDCFNVEADSTRQFYINTSQNSEIRVYTSLSRIMTRLHENLAKHRFTIFSMLKYGNPDDIASILDEEGIQEYNILGRYEYLPQPGDYVPIDVHHLLEKRLLIKREYVAFSEESLLDQMVCDVVPVYRYAKVIREVKQEGNRTYKIYEIDIGSGEKVEKPDFDLYAFKSIYDIEEPISTNTSLPTSDEIKTEVSNILDSSWELEEGVRIRLVTRLMEMWQATENPHRKEAFCNDIVQYIIDENDRLSKVDRTTKQDVDLHFPDDQGDRDQPSYTESLVKVRDYLRARSKKHQQQRQTYLEHINSATTSSSPSRRSKFSFEHSPSFGAKNPQPGEAVRWMKQAKFDLETAQYDALINSKEWICYICLQSAEKALKAALFYIDALEASLSHDIPTIAQCLGDHELITAAKQLQALTGEHTETRYPSKLPYPKTPHDYYLRKDTFTVIELTKQIVDQSQAFMDRLH